VDVFFVISGYLITSLILKDLRQGTFSLATFWERRIRRILPALAVCVLVTLVAGYFLLLPNDLEALGKSSVAQALMGANFYFWRTTNYFGGENLEKPLLHTWSLAVEEQFYLFFPLILLLLFRFPNLRGPRNLITILLCGFLLSLSLSVWGVKHQPYATFFLLPTRAWELLCGAIIAALPAGTMPVSRLLREGASWLGLTGILLPVWLYRELTPFPGLAALPPCLGAALIIWANGRSGDAFHQPRTLAARLLSARAVVFVGLISYSLYLWHWPVIVFANYWKIKDFSVQTSWLLVVISVSLAVVSWIWVETPFRARNINLNRPQTFLFAGSSILVMLVAGIWFVVEKGIPQRISQNTHKIMDLSKASSKYFEMNHSLGDVTSGNVTLFGVGEVNAPVQLLLWGDSHAQAALPAFDTYAKERGITGAAIMHSATSPVIGYYRDVNSHGLRKESLAFGNAVIAFVESHRIRNVVLLACWAGDTYPLAAANIDPFDVALLKTIERLKSVGAIPWIALQVPSQSVNVPRAMLRNYMIPALSSLPVCSRPDGWNGVYGRGPEFLHRLDKAGAKIMDTRQQFIDPSTGNFVMSIDGIPLYFDEGHLNEYGAIRMLLPVIRKSFAPIDWSDKVTGQK
jgi:peptidoglycan/LPS O-acetylase OafA/YrhL